MDISTLVLTLLLVVGLLFFIRASVKDRTEELTFLVQVPEPELLPNIQNYFVDRAYRLVQVDEEKQVIRFEGQVAPSQFLAVFLSFLAGLGLFSFALVLGYLFPAIARWFFGLLLLAPVAGWFYWRKALKVEQVALKLEAGENAGEKVITIQGHRDELIQFRQTMGWSVVNG